MNSSNPSPITPDTLASVYKALGDPMRVEVLRILAADSYGVLELAEIFAVTQPRISHHLKVLANAGLVSTRREGNSIFYRRPQLEPQDALATVKQNAFSAINQSAINTSTENGLARIHKARAEVSNQFFIENAEKFRAQQDLIASHLTYAQAVTELLDNTPTPHKNCALELGPGEGEYLRALAQRFQEVVGLDNSENMLAKAQALSHKHKLNNVSLIHGDTSDLKNRPNTFDCAVVNMVLHHTPSPLAIFKDLLPSLKSQGALLITELCLHDQNWAKEACGDLWLGFDPNDINNWAVEAGFTPGQSVYFALRNGFQIQLKQFFKP